MGEKEDVMNSLDNLLSLQLPPEQVNAGDGMKISREGHFELLVIS